MNYDPFNFSQNQLLQQLPTSYKTTTSLYGPAKTTFGYRLHSSPMAGLSPANAITSQKAEFGRLEGLQSLQAGALQQQQSQFELEQQKRKSEEERFMDLARKQLYSKPMFETVMSAGGPVSRQVDGPKYNIPQYYLERAKREKEMEDLQLTKLRMESGMGGPLFSASVGGGSSGMGFSQSPFGRSWSVPSFPTGG